MCLVVGREPDRHTKIITYDFSMQQTELDCFEIVVSVVVFSNGTTVLETYSLERKHKKCHVNSGCQHYLVHSCSVLCVLIYNELYHF